MHVFLLSQMNCQILSWSGKNQTIKFRYLNYKITCIRVFLEGIIFYPLSNFISFYLLFVSFFFISSLLCRHYIDEILPTGRTKPYSINHTWSVEFFLAAHAVMLPSSFIQHYLTIMSDINVIYYLTIWRSDINVIYYLTIWRSDINVIYYLTIWLSTWIVKTTTSNDDGL